MAAVILKDTEITSSGLTINSSENATIHFGSNNGGDHLLFGPPLGHGYEYNNNIVCHGNILSNGLFYVNTADTTGVAILAKRLVNVQEIVTDTDVTTTSTSSVPMSTVLTYTPLYTNSTVIIDTESNIYTANTGTDDDFVSRWNFVNYTNVSGSSVLSQAVAEFSYHGASNYDPNSMTIHGRLTFNIAGARATDGNIYMGLVGFCSNDTSTGWAMVIGQYYTIVTIQEYV